jgi:carbonic anhydrase/acetyltransferase-like protein (isoleucine patch superfamily)
MESIGSEARSLAEEEMLELERQGCEAEDWAMVKVAHDFSPRGFVSVIFKGSCFLSPLTQPCWDGERHWPSVVKEVELCRVRLAPNVHISRSGLLEDCVVGRGAIIFNCGRLLGSGASLWPVGIDVGNEMGGRKLWLSPEMTSVEAKLQSEQPSRADACFREAKAHFGDVIKGQSWLDQDCTITDVPLSKGVLLSEGTRVSGASLLDGVIALGSPEQPVVIGSGSQVQRSILQWGSVVDGAAQVTAALIGDGCHVGAAAVVEQAFIGHSGGFGKGEVTACVMGPFVAMHHQSLAIGLVWPQGRGNVAYGAKLGSNHTGKCPDQEAFPGEGCFFGLSCALKFPVHLHRAPYSLFAAGVEVPPMRLELPFSLVLPPKPGGSGRAAGLNQIEPAWVLSENLYTLVRSELKFAQRLKSRREPFDSSWLREDTVRLMDQARAKLMALPRDEAWLVAREWPGLGEGVLSRSSVQKAIFLYQRFGDIYALESVLRDPESPWVQRLVEQGLDCEDRALLEKKQVEALGWQLAAIERSRAKDFSRGHRICDDYDEVHVPMDQDPLVLAWREKLSLAQLKVKMNMA